VVTLVSSLLPPPLAAAAAAAAPLLSSLTTISPPAKCNQNLRSVYLGEGESQLELTLTLFSRADNPEVSVLSATVGDVGAR